MSKQNLMSKVLCTLLIEAFILQFAVCFCPQWTSVALYINFLQLMTLMLDKT